MPQSEGDFRVELDESSVRSVLAGAKAASPALATSMRRELRVLGKDMVDAVKAKVLERPPSGGRSSRGGISSAHHIRRDIAAGTSLAISTSEKKQGISVTTTAAKLPAGRKAMAKAYNKKRFRHPVFGDRETWLDQRGNPYFGDTIYPIAADARKRFETALEDMADAVRKA